MVSFADIFSAALPFAEDNMLSLVALSDPDDSLTIETCGCQ